MILDIKTIAYKELAKAYFKAKKDLESIEDMNNLILQRQEDIDIYNYELLKLETEDYNKRHKR